MSTLHPFKFMAPLPNGDTIPVVITSEAVSEYLSEKYPDTPIAHHITLFCQLTGAELLSTPGPSPKRKWEPSLVEEDMLWVTAHGMTIKEAFTSAKNEAIDLPGEDGFMRLFSRYFVVDGRKKDLKTALTLLHTYSVLNTGTRAVGVSVLEPGHFLFYTQRTSYLTKLNNSLASHSGD